MSFELPAHRWRHIQARGPDGKGHYPGVEWWVCEECHKQSEIGRTIDQPMEPGTCWGKKPVPPHIKAIAEWICGKGRNPFGSWEKK